MKSLVPRRSVEVVPTVSASSAYTANDQVGGIQELGSVLRSSEDTFHGALLKDLTIIDEDGQDAVLDVFFFDESPTVASSDNAALSIAIAELVDKCLGYVQVAAADYAAVGTPSVATVRNIDLQLKGKQATSVYVVVATRGTPTYTATDSLTFKYGIEMG